MATRIQVALTITSRHTIVIKGKSVQLQGAVLGGTVDLLDDQRCKIELRNYTVKGGKLTKIAAGKVKASGEWMRVGNSLSITFDGKRGTGEAAGTFIGEFVSNIAVSVAVKLAKRTVNVTATGVGKIASDAGPAPDTSIVKRSAYKPAGEQQFFDGHLCRAWDHPSVSEATLIKCLDNGVRNGFTGFCIELGGHVPSFGGQVNKGGKAYKDAGGIISYHVKQVESARFAFLVAECRKRNYWLWVMDINTNDDAMKGITSVADVSRINAAIMKFGTSGMMRTAMNETDEDTNATLRERYEDVVAGSMPDNQTISSFEKESWAVYTDYHPSSMGKIKSYPKGPRTFVTSDNPGVIDPMTKGSTLGGDGLADIPQHVVFATEAQKIGASWCNYAFMFTFQPELQDALGKVIPKDGSVEPSPVPATGDAVNLSGASDVGKNKLNIAKAPITKRLLSAKWGSGRSISYTYEPKPFGWSKDDPIGDGNIDCRMIFGWVKDGKVFYGHGDWNRPGATSHDTKNLYNGYLKVPRDAEAYFLILANEWTIGKLERTNAVFIEGRMAA